MTDEKKDTENDKNDAVNTVADTKQAKPKQKKKQKKQRNSLFAKYVPPVIEHKKVKPKQNDYDTVFAKASSHGVTGCVYVRGLAGAAILASFVYSSVNVLTYGFTHDVFFSIAQSAFLFLAAFAASSIALIYAERFLQANLAAMSDGQYAAFLDQEEAIRGLVGNPEEHAGKAASKAFAQSLLVAIAGIIIGTMIQFPTVSAAIAVFLLIGLAASSSMFGSRGRIEADSIRHTLDFSVVVVPLVSVFSVFSQCSESGASIEAIAMQALIVSVLLTLCSAVTYRTLEDGNDFDFSHTFRTWRWTFGGGVLAAFCGWMSGAGMLLIGLLIATVVLVALSFYLLHRKGRNIWG